MKKMISIILSVVLLLSMSACQSQAEPTDPEKIGGSMDFDVPEWDLDLDTEGVEATGGSMDFDMPEWNLDLDIDSVEATGGSIDFDVEDFEFDFDEIISVSVESTVIDFSPSDIELDIDIDSFDVEVFVEESGENFTAEDVEKLENMEAEKVIEIAETKANLLADLSRAFQEADLNVQVDEKTGVITLDSAVLFDTNESQVSHEGMEFLCNFMLVYTTVVYHERYDGFVSQVVVEGHTDTNGDYQYNLGLSQDRADSVVAFCLSEKSGLPADILAELAEDLSAVGYSYDYPVYTDSGEVDMDASRRVSFRFLISLD